ncbi:MAG: hypothetical protein WD554_05010 [Flavobacteriaceae bacterium]
MKKVCFLFAIFFIFSGNVFAQKSLSDYAYVLVPQQFEFQKRQDQYLVNTLTRHLFKEAGFNPLYEEELGDLPECEGLYATVISKPFLTLTRITILLKDCNDTIVFESNRETSREKDYQRAYHEALRKAFISIEIMGVDQGDLDSFRKNIQSNSSDVSNKERSPKDFDTSSLTKTEADKRDLIRYQFINEDYFLEKSENDFLLYKKTERGSDLYKVGVLSPTSRKGIYLLKKGETSVLASFDSNDNLVVDALDQDGNPIQHTYMKVE